MSGYLKPYHPGTTRLDFYHYKNGKWRLYRSVEARNVRYKHYAKYRARYRLPHAGRWRVRAYRAGENHAPARSDARRFTVR